MKVKFVVPAGNSQIEEIIEKLEEIYDGMRLSIGVFPFFLDSKVVFWLFFLDDVYDYLFKIAIKSSHVNFAELFLGLIDLLVFNHVFVDQTLIGGYCLENV